MHYAPGEGKHMHTTSLDTTVLEKPCQIDECFEDFGGHLEDLYSMKQ